MNKDKGESKIYLGKDVEDRKFLMDYSIVTERIAIIGQSGSGKSYLASVIAEEFCKNKLNFVIIDTEGEYYSLKEKFDVLWISREKGDVEIENCNWQNLIEACLRKGIPIILDVSEVVKEREVVGDFLSNLFKIESKMKIPTLVIIEEADRFIPQRGEKVEIIKEIAKRGRKRGIGLAIVTQRPSLVDKDVLSQSSLLFIGKLVIENDLKAVSIFFPNRKMLKEVVTLPKGNFFVLTREGIKKLRVRKRITTHVSETPKVKMLKRGKVRELLRELKGKIEKEIIGIKEKFTNFKKLERKKYLFFGEKTKVKNAEKLLVPFYLVTVKKKSFFGSKRENYIIDGLNLVHYKFNNGLKEVCQLKDLLQLSKEEVSFLLSVSQGEYLKKVKKRKVIKDLIRKGLVEIITSGKEEVVVPLIYIKLESSKINLEKIKGGKILKENYSKEVIEELFFKILQFYPRVEKFYYPIFKVTFSNGEIKFIDGVNGKEIKIQI